MDDIKTFRMSEKNNISSSGILCMLIGMLLLLEQGSLFVVGGILMSAGAFIYSARDLAYELLITTKVGEKSVLTSKAILYLTKKIESVRGF
jgi:hypothetical protein